METSGICDESLSLLAQKGSYAYKRIFAEGVPREIISKALKTGVTIQFSSEDFFLPWELLYDGVVGDRVDISHFWGMQHIVSRALIQEARSGDEESPIMQTICPQVGLIACQELEHVLKKEIPALEELHRQHRIILLPLRPLNALQRNEELAFLGQFLQDEQLQIVHLACHAQEKKPRNQSYLLFSDEFTVSIEDFYLRDFNIKHLPDESDLIFLLAYCTSSHRRHSMRLTRHASPVQQFQCQITRLFFGHCGWLTNDGR